MKMKGCRKCRKEKPVEDFYFSRGNARQSRCIACFKARDRRRDLRTPEEKFWARVDVRAPDQCWEWIGQRMKAGYGRLESRPTNGKRVVTLTHRAAWAFANKMPVPKDMFVLHRCDNPPCCNPGHLFLGKSLDNVRDMHAKGRARNQYGPSKAYRKQAS